MSSYTAIRTLAIAGALLLCAWTAVSCWRGACVVSAGSSSLSPSLAAVAFPPASARPPLPVPLWNTTGPQPLWTTVRWTHYPPLGMAELERSFSAPATPEAWCPWARVAAALDAGAPIDIAVLGGSMTLGGQCGEAVCAWPRYLAPWLARARPHWRVTVTNLAASGHGSFEWAYTAIPFLGKRRPDVIIVDTSVNAYMHAGPTPVLYGMDRLMWRLLNSPGTLGRDAGAPPALLYVQEFVLSCEDHRGTAPPPEACVRNPWYWEMGDVEASVVRFYGLPVASYRDAVWPNRSSPPHDLLELWRTSDHGIHAGPVPHELVSDVVKYALGRLLMGSHFPPAGAEAFCSPAGPASHPPALRFSKHAVASMQCAGASHALGFGSMGPDEFRRAALGVGGEWTFGIDVPGKPPGWNGVIRAGLPAPWITFPLFFESYGSGTPSLRVEVTFLRSYEGFADAELRINASGCGAADLAPGMRSGAPHLNGSWARRQSTPFTLTLGSLDVPAQDGAGGFEQVALSPACRLSMHTPYTLTVTLRGGRGPGKFKLLGVSSCVTWSLWGP